MGTRSRIGLELEDGKILSVYCHWDGYPEHNGVILSKHYTDRNKIMTLIENGDLSSLGAEIGNQHDFDDRSDLHENECTFYKRDRGEEGTDARVDENRKQFLEDVEEYGYLFTLQDEWIVSDHGDPFISLTDAVVI